MGVPHLWATVVQKFPEEDLKGHAPLRCTASLRQLLRFATLCIFSAEFNDLGIEQTAVFQCETKQGPDPMESLHSSRTWIQMDASPGLHGLHEQEVAVSTDEYIRTVLHQSGSDALCVSAGSSSNVGHPNAAATALEVLMLGKVAADELIVYVAVDSDQGSH